MGNPSPHVSNYTPLYEEHNTLLKKFLLTFLNSADGKKLTILNSGQTERGFKKLTIINCGQTEKLTFLNSNQTDSV